MNELADPKEEQLYRRVSGILTDARGRIARTVNTEMVNAYWRIGREIVEVEQLGAARASYADELIARLAIRLTKDFGKGMSARSLRRIRQFYLTYSTGSAIPHEIWPTVLAKSQPIEFPPLLSWSHYVILLSLPNPRARGFYEIETARESWSLRELERQIAAMLFERLALKGDEKQLATNGQQISKPEDVIKDPFVLEFLDLKEPASAQERDLEQVIIDRLEDFLLELGKGFCFVGRQKRVTLEGDHFYVDLVFYNRILRCFVLVDLKLGKLVHGDLGQMQMYVNFFDRFQRLDGEAKTIGIVLCSDKNEAMVRITLPEDNQQILAARYQQILPTEEELRERLSRDRSEAERALEALPRALSPASRAASVSALRSP
jgi:predicted nuclease of restriction endonuclease-like (RecB) superfamily